MNPDFSTEPIPISEPISESILTSVSKPINTSIPLMGVETLALTGNNDMQVVDLHSTSADELRAGIDSLVESYHSTAEKSSSTRIVFAGVLTIIGVILISIGAASLAAGGAGLIPLLIGSVLLGISGGFHIANYCFYDSHKLQREALKGELEKAMNHPGMSGAEQRRYKTMFYQLYFGVSKLVNSINKENQLKQHDPQGTQALATTIAPALAAAMMTAR